MYYLYLYNQQLHRLKSTTPGSRNRPAHHEIMSSSPRGRGLQLVQVNGRDK